MMKTAEIRQRFLDYFKEREHALVSSSPLVPHNDPTLLFTNAGMVQFKDVFLGDENVDYVRATTAQKCVRAGGKHNDLENVGYTARHHTFFEMMGNFSFGDYFKRDAIRYAWEFLTVELKLPAEKLWVTIYEEDEEAQDIWLNEIGVDGSRFSKIGAKDNFWSMGDVGPCGPCSEIFYDHGSDYWGGPPGTPEEDGDRYIEIWNLVFMQYNRSADGSLHPLPKPSVDTGMGLERIAAVMQGVNNNYEIDLFEHLTSAICECLSVKDKTHHSVRVIADHIRSCSFLIGDGVLPSNEGRGYVLRRIIRRALRHGYQLGGASPFFHTLVQPLVDEMGGAYPDLLAKQSDIEQVIRKEELRFAETLEQGLKIFEQKTQGLITEVLPGDLVFQLYDTYGFPADLTADVAREKGLSIDLEGFNLCMSKQQERARAHSQFSAQNNLDIDVTQATQFVGYDTLTIEAQVLALYKGDQKTEQLLVGEQGYVILDKTPCYAEGGGQIGDSQAQLNSGGAKAVIQDCQKQANDVFVHQLEVLEGVLSLGDIAQVTVNEEVRKATAANHSATHLLHAALKLVLGDSVQQKGSLVDAEKLRFDFSYDKPLTQEQLAKIESHVNNEIFNQVAISDELLQIDEAKKRGAEALFGEKYGDEVRVIGMGTFSLELCGGTHVNNTADIASFKIISESGVAAGIRRIEALTRRNASHWFMEKSEVVNTLAQQLKTQPNAVLQRVSQLQAKIKMLEAEKKALQQKISQGASPADNTEIKVIGDISVLVSKVEGYDKNMLRDHIDRFKNKYSSGVIVLAASIDGKITLMAGVSKAISKRYPAGDLIKTITALGQGRGGGRPDMAEGGIVNIDKLEDCLAHVTTWVQGKSQ